MACLPRPREGAVPVIPAEELSNHIGEETGRSQWFAIDQERINAFSKVTLDDQWIHTDIDAAKEGPFGTTIAHGFLTLSLLSYLTSESTMLPEGALMIINYGSDKVRFLSPVKVGSRVRAVSVLSAVTQKAPGQILIESAVTVEIEGEEKPALVANVLTLAIMGGT